MIAIINYGVGNLLSIHNMFKKIGIEAAVTSDPAVLSSASKIILPGVGAFDNCMSRFRASGLDELVTRRVFEEGTPILGICVGLQMLTEGSEEGMEKGLGWIKGRTVRFDAKRLPPGAKIPHMGWSEVQHSKESALVRDLGDGARFYFVHSYHLQLEDQSDELLTCEYGYKFTCAIERGNVMGAQFHPEKSHRFGMAFLRNFATA